MDVQQRLALLWINQQSEVTSGLLVNSISDLADGAVLCELLSLLQVRFRAAKERLAIE